MGLGDNFTKRIALNSEPKNREEDTMIGTTATTIIIAAAKAAAAIATAKIIEELSD